MPFHNAISTGDIHIIINWIYADATARGAASGFVAADVGKVAWQQSDDTFWLLKDDSPITWVQIGGTGSPTGSAGGALAGTYPNPDLDSAIAGSGLGFSSNVVSVNVDDSTIEINTDTLRVKDAGVTVAKLATAAKETTINVVIDGAGATITTGIKLDLVVDFACTILSATLLADQTGSIVIDIWKDSYTNYPPTDADSITASAPPTISTATKSQDATLTGWTTSISAGDTLRFNVDSVTDIERVTLALKVRRA